MMYNTIPGRMHPIFSFNGIIVLYIAETNTANNHTEIKNNMKHCCLHSVEENKQQSNTIRTAHTIHGCQLGFK